MKTKEFLKKVKSLGFEIRIEYGRKGELVEFRIGDDEEDFVVIWPKFTFAISTIEGGFMDLKYPLPLKELYKLCFEYASTPIGDREEEKKFYLKHRWLENREELNYLNFEISGLYYGLNTKCEASWSKTKFTLKEIEDIKEKFDTDLKDFELVEVVDEN